MKKFIISLFACGLAALAFAAQPANVLETSTNARTGNTTTLSVGFGSFRKLPDGNVIVTASPLVVVTDSEGKEIKRSTEGDEIVVTLTPQQAEPIFALFAAVYAQQKAAAEAQASK